MVENHVVIFLSHLVANQRIVARALRAGEFQTERRCVDIVHLDGNDFFELFDAALHLNRLGCLIAETLYERLGVGNFLLLIFIGAQLLFAAFGTQAHVFVVLHLVIVHLATAYL